MKGNKGVCWGLHGTITAEWDKPRWGPVLPRDQVPTLVDVKGHFLQSTRDLHARQPSHAEVLAELQAQLDRARGAGLNIEYIDEHMAYGWFPDLLEKLHDFARREGLIYGRDTVDRLPDVDGHFDTKVDHFLARLDRAQPGQAYLHVIHPGCDDLEMRTVGNATHPLGAVARDREADRKVFTDPRVLQAVQERNIEIVRYTDVMQP